MESAADGAERTRNGRPLRANRGKNPNARWLVDEAPPKKPAKRRKSNGGSAKRQPPQEEITEGEVKCRCDGAVSDDKTMAECENCQTWQHIVCEFGVDDESALPKPKYFCHACRDDAEDGEHANSPSTKPPVKNEAASAKTGTQAKTGADPANGGADPANGGADPAETGAHTVEAIEDKVRRSVAEAFLEIVGEKHEGDEFAAIDHASAERLAVAVEQALYDGFAENKEDPASDVGSPYREQYRTLSFNLKDAKNQWLRQRLVTGKLLPSKFARMTSEDLRNPELQQLAEEAREESLRETVIQDDLGPPTEKISTATAEVDVEPTYQEFQQEDIKNEAELDEAMRQPLGPPPGADAGNDGGAGSGGDGAGTESGVDAGVGDEIAAGEGRGPSKPRGLEIPVWLGTLKLADETISLDAKGFHVRGHSRSAWPSLTTSTITMEGLVQADRGMGYLTAIAEQNDGPSQAVLAIVSEDTEKLTEMYDYMHSRDRVGSLKVENARVKDAYLVPYVNADSVEFLALNDEQSMFLNHLKTEHAEKVLLAVYVIDKSRD